MHERLYGLHVLFSRVWERSEASQEDDELVLEDVGTVTRTLLGGDRDSAIAAFAEEMEQHFLKEEDLEIDDLEMSSSPDASSDEDDAGDEATFGTMTFTGEGNQLTTTTGSESEQMQDQGDEVTFAASSKLPIASSIKPN